MENLLKEKGYKKTPARMAIMNIISKNHIPLTAEKIYKELQKEKDGKNINEATVYRTLNDFTESGILKKVDLRGSSMSFELASHHHHHMVCVKCDSVEDFENKKIEEFLEKVAKNSKKFKKITEHSLELFGLCKKCI